MGGRTEGLSTIVFADDGTFPNSRLPLLFYEAALPRGEVTPEQFDFTALRWDFGDAGRRALARLERSSDAKVAELAQAGCSHDG